MRRFIFAVLLPLALVLAGCGMNQGIGSETTFSTRTSYSSDTSAEDCYLCGGGIENLIPSYWVQNNIALISLNTFEIKPLEINRYDKIDGRLIEEYAGTVSFGGAGSKDGGFSASLMQDSDRGYATGSVDFNNDEVLDISKTANFLCENCLNELLPSQIDRCFGVGVVNLATKEIRIFEERLSGFTSGNFYIDCDLQDQGVFPLDPFPCHSIRWIERAQNTPSPADGRRGYFAPDPVCHNYFFSLCQTCVRRASPNFANNARS